MMSRKRQIKPVPEPVQLLVESHARNPESTLESLHELHKQQGAISTEDQVAVADVLRIPAHRVYGVATFFSMLSPLKKKNILRACDGPVCWLRRATMEYSKGGKAVFDASADRWQDVMDPKEWQVERNSCLGLCDRAPAILVNNEQTGPVIPENASEICEGWRGVQVHYEKPRKGETRVMLAGAGKINPDSIESAVSHGAYNGLKRSLGMTPDAVIAEISASSLQGRGGAGFPTGAKWDYCRQAPGNSRYVICNADESEPLVFKDRVLIDSNPHRLLEGIIIAGYAVDAGEAWIYIRGEYESQAKRLELAIHQAEENGYLGGNILGSGYSYRIHVHRGAGAYICGEETALIESLEGKRGEPRVRPPYPPTCGFRGCPTVVNNVETLCAVGHIMENDANWWKKLSNYPTPGVKIYMVLGHVKKPGLFEAPFGITLRQAIYDYCGGMSPGSRFKFALTGGAAGTIVGKDMLDVPLDYSSHKKGISLGAGAFLVCDHCVPVAGILRELLHFFSEESCGKCTPCRVGSMRALELIKSLAEGVRMDADVKELINISRNLSNASFCGLGQAIAIPIDSALKNFPDEFSSVTRQ